ncbi:hypothetical protein VI817_003317 [Penicillium citrinum]|nr:hypothetical protein VI817_003317 [Penicillium citrinum]
MVRRHNAPIHTARIVKAYLARLGRKLIWPPYHSGLNPIENLWTLLKQKIYQIQSDLLHMPNNYNTLAIITATAQTAWKQLHSNVLEGLSESMPCRVKAVIDSDGWYT